MASLYANEQLPSTSEEAIRKFDEKYLAVASVAPPSTWADRFIESVDAPRITYPLSFASGKFLETKEESGRFKGMQEKSADLKVVEYDNGYEAKAFDLTTNVFAYRNWIRVPELFRLAEARHYAKLAAALIDGAAGATCAFDGVNFFSASHKAHPFLGNGTWSNYNASGADPATIANIQAEMVLMQAGVLDLNGDKYGADPDEIWLPTAKYQVVSDKLNQAFLANGESNYMAGKLKVVHVPELTDDTRYMLVDSKMLSAGFNPLVVAKYAPSATLGLRFWDENSDFFKDTGKVKASSHIWAGGALLFPHAIRCVDFSA